MRVLIVDDQAANRVLLSDMVTGFGYACLSVDDGVQALHVVQDFRPDVVLLDVLMPGMSGLQTAPELKASAADTHLPIIFITALDDQATLLQCLEAGGDDFISKPFEPVVLEAKLRAHFRTRELSQSLVEKNKALAYHSSRVEREHQIVEHIFQNSLTHNYLDYPHLQTYLSSLSMFNGDLLLAAPGPLGSMYLLLGDFTGHGLSAAVGALPTSQTFFSMAESGAAVGEISRAINQRLHQLLPNDMFLAAVVLEVSASGERITYWNGGIPPALLVGAKGQVSAELKPQHLALGILSDLKFDSGVSVRRVTTGDSLVLYSDGVTELPCDDGLLGFDGLARLVQESEMSMGVLTQKIQALMQQHQQRDDVSLAWLRCQPTGIRPRPDYSQPSPLSFTVHVELDADDIRQQDPINRMVRDLAHIEGFSRFKAQIFTVLQETYNNAVEHGLLQLDSNLKQGPDGFERYYEEYERRLQTLEQGLVRIDIEYKAKQSTLHIRVTDSGPGWCAQPQPEVVSMDETFGRGLRLVKELTTQMSWSNGGRCIECVLPLKRL
ncbi:ATP-binding SpoIIE family protein phosphatase [Aliidiomarina sp. Khilg15.8]